MKETKEFQTESKELLNLMINSIYTNKEIFLRELISNASDAIDKYKYVSLTSNEKIPANNGEIVISKNKKDRTITITDNGIGMSKEDLINDLGTIAKSGSKDFVSKLKKAQDAKDLNIIGQFGVGFYSAFMVAKKIDVKTKEYGKGAYLFTSDGVDTYSIEDASMDESNGTSITIYLKDNDENNNYDDYLEDFKIEDLVKKYSDYVRYPIKMDEITTKPKLDKDGKEIKDQTETVTETKTLNSMIPLWKKNKNDVKEEDLNAFYKSKFGDYEDPLASMLIKVDGIVSYDALVYIPSHAPYNLYSENYEKGLDLYSKGVFVKEKCKELVPDYLKFIKGLVDSNDFSLNVSREMLQSSPVLRKIEDNIENKVVAKLREIKENDYEKYLKFFDTFGDHIKFGIYSSYGAKNDLLKDLLVFDSLNSEKPIGLKEYKDKMVKDQKYIYYATGKTIDSMKLLPQIEKYKKDGIDVLLFKNNIDEFAIMMMKEYEKLEFKNIEGESKDSLTKEEKDKIDSLTANNKRILDDLKESLKGKVDEVAFSTKLVDSPVCVTTKNGVSMNMENVINNEPGVKDSGSNEVKAVKVLEINPEHELFKSISTLTDDEEIKKYGSLLYDEAMLLEGFDIKDKAEFVKNLNNLMLGNISKK